MNKIYKFLIAFILLSNVSTAQYYYVPFLNANTNPGGLNVDDEYPVGSGLPATWITLTDSANVPAWSPNATIPFAFNFNGSPVTQYKVSTSGVLTFTTGATTVPPYSLQSLPSASVPDNSVCILGLRGTGANDNIVTKTFGTAPNRQHWVLFSSYSTSNASVFTYWSIVLEESTNNVYIVDQRHNLAYNVSAGLQLNSTTAVAIAGSPALSTVAGADPTSADNTYYQFIYGSQPADQAKLKSVSYDPYVIVPGNVFIEGVVQNFGANPITAMDIKYESAGTVYTTTLTSLSIASNASYSFIHNTPLNVSLAAPYPIKVWVDVAGDLNHNDDTLNFVITGLSFQPTKRVLIEEGTGTWCGWCPRGAVFTEQIDTVYSGTAIVVAVHNGDLMTDAIYDAGMGNLISGYPSGAVDRKSIDVDPTDFGTAYLERINDVAPADVAVSAFFNTVSRQVDVVVSATFAASLNGDFRLNAILVEDDVTGTNSQYSQVNYYSFQSQNIALVGAGHNWQTEPTPVPFSSMVYDFVGRNLMGGYNGLVGSIPSSVSDNTTYSYTFSTTIPTTWNANNMRVIGMLQDGNLSTVLNVNRGAYGITTAVNEITAETFSMALYPNPASYSTQLELNFKNSSSCLIELFDVMGKVVYKQQLNATAGKNNFNIPLNGLNSGIYMVRVAVDGSALNTRLLVK